MKTAWPELNETVSRPLVNRGEITLVTSKPFRGCTAFASALFANLPFDNPAENAVYLTYCPAPDLYVSHISRRTGCSASGVDRMAQLEFINDQYRRVGAGLLAFAGHNDLTAEKISQDIAAIEDTGLKVVACHISEWRSGTVVPIALRGIEWSGALHDLATEQQIAIIIDCVEKVYNEPYQRSLENNADVVICVDIAGLDCHVRITKARAVASVDELPTLTLPDFFANYGNGR